MRLHNGGELGSSESASTTLGRETRLCEAAPEGKCCASELNVGVKSLLLGNKIL